MSVMLFKRRPQNDGGRKRSWTNQDIADFYRTVDILKQAGLTTETDSGITDEGDPWFVFTRPETGEVVAHFAEIDGQFIAVSSLNQQVYKAKDIRAIVDQMLASHPMLLPQSKSGAKILLHPTAALSAFIAAAFIMAIDGVKASNIDEIMVAAAAENLTNTIAITSSTENVSKLEDLRSMFSDLQASNYNVAILGAALIVREVSQEEINFEVKLNLQESVADLSGEKIEVSGSTEDYIIVRSEGARHFDNSGAETYSVNDLDLTLGQGEKGQVRSEKKLVDGKENNDVFDRLIIDEASIGEGLDLGDQYEVSWKNSEIELNINYSANTQGLVIKTNKQFDPLPHYGVELKQKTINLSAIDLPDNLLSSFQLAPSEYNLSTSSGLDGLGVTLASSGEIKIVSLESLNFDNEPEFNGVLGVATNEAPSSMGRSAEVIAASGYIEYENHSKISEGANVVVSSPQQPIIGHVLVESGEALKLGEATDVVFYQGGDTYISNFELGTDLLWFFLSTEELSMANNSINDRGDLVVDFGEIGSLTFLEMISNTSDELMI